MSDLRRSPLHDRHEALGAAFTPFGPWEMPLKYGNELDEHRAVRTAAGLFDLSHMGEIRVTGPDAAAYLDHTFISTLSTMPQHKAKYTMLVDEDGGILDDLIIYRLGEAEFLVVPNAGNTDVVWGAMQARAEGRDVTLANESLDSALVAVQGPRAEEILLSVVSDQDRATVADMKYYTCAPVDVLGEEVLCARTGYTGEDGFEIYGSYRYINNVWDKLVGSGEVKPCGLGCRDTLRFEVGLPLYGDELTDEITPLEAGLGMFAKLEKDFIGRDALVQQKTEGLKRKIVGIELKDKAIPRHGYEVEADGKVVGVVTTGYNSISTGKSVCMAMLDIDYTKLGTEVAVRIRKKVFPGVVTKKRFYDKNYKK